MGREMAFLVYGKLNMTQPCALVKKKANHIQILECVQRSTTEMVERLQGISDEEWLKILGFYSLEKRRPHCYLKLPHGGEWRGKCCSLSQVSGDRMQGNTLKLMSMPDISYWLRETSSSALPVFCFRLSPTLPVIAFSTKLHHRIQKQCEIFSFRLSITIKTLALTLQNCYPVQTVTLCVHERGS